MGRSGKRCAVYGCNNTRKDDGKSVFLWPRDPVVSGKWDTFIRTRRRDFSTHGAGSYICQAHFKSEHFENEDMVKLGQACRLRLVKGAIPSIQAEIELEDDQHSDASHPSAARSASTKLEVSRLLSASSEEPAKKKPKCRPTRQVVPRSRSIGIQCDLSQSDPIKSVKSKGCQVSMQVSHVETQCNRIYEDVLESKSANTVLSPNEDPKYIVFQSQLLQLLGSCPSCAAPARVELSKKEGTAVHFSRACSKCAYSGVWVSQPYLHKMPAGNLLLSGAILFSGCSQSSVFRLLNLMNIASFSSSTFFRHQRDYLHPTVFKLWKAEKEENLSLLHGLQLSGDGGLQLSGDCRSDSPGHCAKYGSYTVIENRLNKVLSVQIVQSNEVPNASWCELEGLKRTLTELDERGLEIDQLVTDRHRQCAKWLKDNHPDVHHYYDAWHMAKGIGKCIDRLAKEKGCEDLGPWRQSITNHLYWSAASSESGDEVAAKWESSISHICDIHEAFDNRLFPRCQHARLEDGDYDWLEPDSHAVMKLEKVLLRKAFTNDLKKVSRRHQTSSLEAFHSLLLMFVPKHSVYSYLGMYSRSWLAALHYNENSIREQAVTANGSARYAIKFPKFKKGGFSVRPIKTMPTYNYSKCLMSILAADYLADFKALRSSIDHLKALQPQPLSAQFEHPDVEDAIAGYIRRFNV